MRQEDVLEVDEPDVRAEELPLRPLAAVDEKAIPADQAPREWDDLLDPKWRGKLVTAHPGYSGVIATHVLALVHLHGWDYFKALAQNKPMLVQSAVDPSGVVASGERPVAVDGGLKFAYIKAGELFTCGVTSDGAAWCWGDNEYGQLGDGSFTGSAVPVKVAFQP